MSTMSPRRGSLQRRMTVWGALVLLQLAATLAISWWRWDFRGTFLAAFPVWQCLSLFLLGLLLPGRKLLLWIAAVPVVSILALWLSAYFPRPAIVSLAFIAVLWFSLGLLCAGRLAASVIYALLLALLVYPILDAISSGFVKEGHFTLTYLAGTLADPSVRSQFVHSLALAACTTVVSLLIALPPAILRARCRFAGSGPLGTLLLLPMILPPFVGACL